MTSPGRYQPPSGSQPRSSGDAATRGAVLIVVAVAIGVALLWWGGVGGDESLVIEAGQSDDTATDADDDPDDADDTDTADATDATATTDTSATDATPDTTSSIAAPTSTRPVGEVKVVVANGVGEAGLAGSRTEVLSTAGYVTKAYNAKCEPDCATSQIALSTVFYKTGYADDAAGVAIALGGDSNVLRPAPADVLTLLAGDNTADVADFHVYVILGADRILG